MLPSRLNKLKAPPKKKKVTFDFKDNSNFPVKASEASERRFHEAKQKKVA